MAKELTRPPGGLLGEIGCKRGVVPQGALQLQRGVLLAGRGTYVRVCRIKPPPLACKAAPSPVHAAGTLRPLNFKYAAAVIQLTSESRAHPSESRPLDHHLGYEPRIPRPGRRKHGPFPYDPVIVGVFLWWADRVLSHG